MLIPEKSNRQLAKGVVRESVLEIAGMFLWILGLVTLAEKLVEWLTGESKYGFIGTGQSCFTLFRLRNCPPAK